MARRRYLSTDISVDEQVAELIDVAGPYAGLLYTWMIPHADDSGQIVASPRKLAMLVIPGIRAVTLDDLASYLEAMERLGLIAWDRERDVISFPPASFYRYQTYIPEEKRRPECGPHIADDDEPSAECGDNLSESPTNSADQRETPLNAAERRGSPQNTASRARTPSPSFSPSLSVRENGSVADATAPVSIDAKRIRAPNAAWLLLEDVGGVLGADPSDLGGARGRQAAVAKRLLSAHSHADVVGCARWLFSDAWHRDKGIDMFVVERELPRWINAGRPPPRNETVPGGIRDGPNGDGQPSYPEFSGYGGVGNGFLAQVYDEHGRLRE